ncbi:MAG: SMC family ATPase [Chloroflexi bacterium]|nr:SMC family ATPase [Chloroflexota bacterium]
MIPLKLTMHNFMCYREAPPLSFRGIHTACICGDNGNGKSALIDAMTWAVWGKARGSDAELITLGQNDMAVEFDFAVGQQEYRVIRKYSRPKRATGPGQSILEFQIATENGFRPLTGNTKNETQKKITDVLHLDYDTFINSALLLQGRADEFTLKPPAERKQVLADILGLSRYDELEERAKALAREWQDRARQLEQSLAEINEELKQKPACEAEMAAAQIRLAQVHSDVRKKEVRLDQLRRERDSLESKKTQLAELDRHMADSRKSLASWERQIAQHQSRIGEYEGTMAQRPAIEEGYAHLVTARRQNDELTQRLKLLLKLNERAGQLEREIERASAELLKNHGIIQSRIGELETKWQKLPRLKSDLSQVQAEQPRLAEAERAIAEKRQADHDLRSQIHYIEASQIQMAKDIKEIDEKLDLLTQSGARCPLCEQALDAAHRQQLGTKLSCEKQDKSELLKANQANLSKQRGELELVGKELARLEAKLSQERASFEGRSRLLSKEVAEAEESGKRLDEERASLAEIEQHLASRDFATAEQQRLAGVKEEVGRLGYDAHQHEEVRQQLISLEKWEESQRKLEEADRMVGQERETLARSEEAARELSRALAEAGEKRESLCRELEQLPGLLGELAQAETEFKALTEAWQQVQAAVVRAGDKLERLQMLEARKQEKTGQLKEASDQAQIYVDLAEAFGKKGVQALLIETALPEIEIEADELLSRMTDNRMHVKIETQREKKTGGIAETLDINISDELGTRNYELFSGGEAFRINFAIRIALSRLLARRAGAPLPTLIIDEGFGTQDSNGIEKLKEAITSIQDGFEKVLVITHIEELKEAFPVRISVTKTAEGATLAIS